MTDRKPYATIEQMTDSNQWKVRPLIPGFTVPMEKADAIVTANALNQAYERGRGELQSELRYLIGAATDEEYL